jgi:hypothetical protein
MTSLKEAVDDLLNNPQLTVEEAMDRHFAANFRQRTNGTWDDRASFMARMRDLRQSAARVTFTVLDELSDGARYAERHRVDLVHRDGERMRLEVYVFAERDAAGRFVRIEESTLVLESGENMPNRQAPRTARVEATSRTDI